MVYYTLGITKHFYWKPLSHSTDHISSTDMKNVVLLTTFFLFLCLLKSSSPDGLVSILKRRRASLDGLPPPNNIVTKQISKRKVRFSEPEDGTEQGTV